MLWSEPPPPANRRYQLLVEQFEVAQQFASLDNMRQAIERAHNEHRISDEVYEERKHAIFVARVGLETTAARIEQNLAASHNQPPVPKTTREPATIAHEKELLTDELDTALAAGITKTSLSDLQRYSAMIARINAINREQQREMEARIEELRETEEDERVSPRRRQEARRQRERTEKFIRDQMPVIADAVQRKQLLIAEQIRRRTKRQPLFRPLYHLYDEFDDVPVARNQAVSHAPEATLAFNDDDDDDNDEADATSIISSNE